ncbi:MAG: ATP-binding protein [Rhodoferax sp.]|nr:ATP-binding protein [Rhodoferax sp.]MCF8208475.1 ATP-binding protein [Rhodoferax sp.]
MLKTLKLSGVGPSPAMELNFGDRLNLITGDNGLGKSFLLDIAFWAMTRRWPGEVNKRLTTGRLALPRPQEQGDIAFSFTGKTATEQYTSHFDRQTQSWTGRSGRPANPGLVLYAMADGGFALWDPARNYWRTQAGVDVQERRPAYVFSPQDVWDGLEDEAGIYCNGLIRDVANWQREQGDAWTHFVRVLKTLSANEDETLFMGQLTRISLDDARDMPTLTMPYGLDVPVVHASSGMRRILALAYLLVWAWEEHLKASQLLAESSSNQAVFLIDEIESHLHPKWQFSVIGSLVSVMKNMAPTAQVQLITATHSPQVLASLEPFFDATQDAWFDLDYTHGEEGAEVALTQRIFEKHGTVSNWLTSEAFDLASDRAPEIAKLLDEASALVNQASPNDLPALQAMNQRLLLALNPKDAFLFRWRALAEHKGWQP